MTEADSDAGPLRRFERARGSAQLSFIEAWLRRLPNFEPSPAPAPPRFGLAEAIVRASGGDDRPRLRRALLEQRASDLRRDAARVRAALAGQTPSAPDARFAGDPEGFARHEAAHAAESALHFLQRAGQERLDTPQSWRAAAGAIERAQRWLQRLQWECSDVASETTVDCELAEAIAEALASTPAEPRLRAALAGYVDRVRTLRGELSAES